MLMGISIALILFGITCILVGDRTLPIKGGKILQLFSIGPQIPKVRKWLIGLGAIYAGGMILYLVLVKGIS